MQADQARHHASPDLIQFENIAAASALRRRRAW